MLFEDDEAAPALALAVTEPAALELAACEALAEEAGAEVEEAAAAMVAVLTDEAACMASAVNVPKMRGGGTHWQRPSRSPDQLRR